MLTVTKILEKMNEKNLPIDEWILYDVYDYRDYFCIVKGKCLEDEFWCYEEHEDAIYEERLEYDDKYGWRYSIGIYDEDEDKFIYQIVNED